MVSNHSLLLSILTLLVYSACVGIPPAAPPEGDRSVLVTGEISQELIWPDSFATLENTKLSDTSCWELTFEDNFNGSDLNTRLWDTGYKAGDKEAQYYVDDAFELQKGLLLIRAEKRQVKDRKYASGIITTQGIFDQRYGRFETRVKVPAGQGLWPAFWLLPSSKNYPLEIDVFEILGHETHKAYMTNHWRDSSGKHTSKTYTYKGPDFSQGFHTYTAVWTPEEIIWYVDGIYRARETRGIPQEPMFMLLNLAVGGVWPGYPDQTTPFPSYMEVDYVRAYQWMCHSIVLGKNQPKESE